MASLVFNIAKGRIVELFSRVKNNDPVNSSILIVPLETTGLESDATLLDKDDLAAVLSGTTNEQATMGRKTLTDADLPAISAPDDTNDWREVSLPAVVWTAATGNDVSKLVICYKPDTASVDSAIIPLLLQDAVIDPVGVDVQMNSGVCYRAK